MTLRTELCRVLDVNINRAQEGLRVAEDVVRFCLRSPTQFHALRRVRHALAGAIRGLSISPAERAAARDSAGDPGRRIYPTPIESVERLLLINLQRAKEAVRVIEEVSRLVRAGQARRVQQVRFQLYDVERHLVLRVEAVRHRRRRRRARTRPRVGGPAGHSRRR